MCLLGLVLDLDLVRLYTTVEVRLSALRRSVGGRNGPLTWAISVGAVSAALPWPWHSAGRPQRMTLAVRLAAFVASVSPAAWAISVGAVSNLFAVPPPTCMGGCGAPGRPVSPQPTIDALDKLQRM